MATGHAIGARTNEVNVQLHRQQDKTKRNFIKRRKQNTKIFKYFLKGIAQTSES